jgi:hypothetical protein
VISGATADRIVVEEGRHSTRGASSSTRWRNCHGSINLTEKLLAEGKIKNITNRAAAEGTAAHLVLGACLEDGSDANEMHDVMIEVGDWTFVVDDEMVAGVQETLNWVRNRVSRAKVDGFEVTVYVERSLGSFTDDDVFGTPDVIIHIHDDRLIVVDFKYGRGISVEPTSDQNYYYGYLGVENYLSDPNEISVVESWIAQPRIPHPDGTIRRHITNAQELIDWWFNELLPDIAATRRPDAELVIGEHCRFCPNKGHCPALKNEVFEFPIGIDAIHLTNEQLGDILNKLKAIKAVEATFEAEGLRRARQGDKIPGFKLVRKMGNRVYKNEQPIRDPEDPDKMIIMKLEDAAITEFGMDAYTNPTLLSPAQIEKLPGGNEFARLWAYKPDNGLTLASVSDKRTEVRPNIERIRGVARTAE